jgi:hypothetical protein
MSNGRGKKRRDRKKNKEDARVFSSRSRVLNLAGRDTDDNVSTVDKGLEGSLCCSDLMERREDEREGGLEGKEVDSEGDAL